MNALQKLLLEVEGFRAEAQVTEVTARRCAESASRKGWHELAQEYLTLGVWAGKTKASLFEIARLIEQALKWAENEES